MAFHNLARMYSATTGTSDAVMTTAVPGCNTWDLAGVANGEIVKYKIITYSTTTNRPTHSEVGFGTYTTSTKTLARTTVESSTNGGSKITLTGLSEVFINPSAGDMPNIFAVASSNYDATSILTTANEVLDLDTELVDDYGIISLAADVATVALAGWYDLHAVVSFDVTASADGNIAIAILNNGSSDDTFSHLPILNGATLSGVTTSSYCTVYLTAGQTVQVKLYNNTANTVSAYVQELRFVRLGD
jgi:hypothetical protein